MAGYPPLELLAPKSTLPLSVPWETDHCGCQCPRCCHLPSIQSSPWEQRQENSDGKKEVWKYLLSQPCPPGCPSDPGHTQLQMLAGGLLPWLWFSSPLVTLPSSLPPQPRNAAGSLLLPVPASIPISVGSLNPAHTPAPAFHLFSFRTLPDTASSTEKSPASLQDFWRCCRRRKITFSSHSWSYSFLQIIFQTFHLPWCHLPCSLLSTYSTHGAIPVSLILRCTRPQGSKCGHIALQAWEGRRRTPNWSRTGNKLKLI